MAGNEEPEVFFNRQLNATVSPNNTAAIVPVSPQQDRTNSNIRDVVYNNRNNPPGMYGWLTQVKNIPIHPDYKRKGARDRHGSIPAANEIFALKLETNWGPARQASIESEGANKVFANFYGDMMRIGNGRQPADTNGFSRVSVIAYRGDGSRQLIDRPEDKGLEFITFIPNQNQITGDQRNFLTDIGALRQVYAPPRSITLNPGDPDRFGNIFARASSDDGRYFFYVGLRITDRSLLENSIGGSTLSSNLQDISPNHSSTRSVLVQIIDNPNYVSHVEGDPLIRNGAPAPAFPVSNRNPLTSNFDNDTSGAGGCFYPWTPKNNIGERAFSHAGKVASAAIGTSALINGPNHPDYREWCELDATRFNTRGNIPALPAGVRSGTQDARDFEELHQNPVYYLYENWKNGKFQYLIDRFKSVNPPHPQGTGGRRTIYEGRRFRRGAREGGYTYGAHGFSNYACPDETAATLNIGTGGVATVVQTLIASDPAAATLNVGDSTDQKVIIDFDFPKITSTDLSDEEFQSLRKKYQKRLQDYPELLDLWVLKKDLYDEYLAAYENWLKKEKLSFDNLFTRYYNPSQINDADTLRRNIISFYNSFAIFNPISNKKVMNCSLDGTISKLTARSEVSESDVLEVFKEGFWFQLYFSIRVMETGIKISQAEHNKMLSIIRDVFDTDPKYAKEKATILISSKTKGIRK